MARRFVLLAAFLTAVIGWAVWWALSDVDPDHDHEPVAEPQVREDEFVMTPEELATIHFEFDFLPPDNTYAEVFVQAAVFPDGEEIDVVFRPLEYPELDYPESFSEAYPLLLKDAEDGNAYAAGELGSSLMRCDWYAPRSETDLRKSIEQMYQTHSRPSPTSDRSWKFQARHLEIWPQYIKETFEFCKGISEEQMKQGKEWWKVAADAGLPWAMASYGITTGGSEGFRYLEESWAAGIWYGLDRLRLFYVSDSSHYGGVVPRDKVTAYAYSYLYHFFHINGHGPKVGIVDDFRPKSEDKLRNESLGLSESEIEMAMDVAKAMLRSNEHCCYY